MRVAGIRDADPGVDGEAAVGQRQHGIQVELYDLG
jgi:hypothetical protein